MVDAHFTQTDTIAALSSGALPSGVAIVRISGPGAGRALAALAGGLPDPRRASLRAIRTSAGDLIDSALVIFFPGPRTATGEDLAEIHLHGGRAVVAACLEALTALPGLRLARAGEFTRRAFDHGRIDLTAAEGLADLLAAETEGQRRQALAQAEGGLKRLYDDWMSTLSRSRAMLEAEFDFSDEGDVPENVSRAVLGDISSLIRDLRGHLASARRGEIVREGFRVAIVGAPNAGKSTLLNALARREVAIVSDRPGTTRDVLEVLLDLGGVPVRLFDTAGLREAEDEIEAIGVERAIAALRSADLVLKLVASNAPTHVKQLTVPAEPGQEMPKILTIASKSDLGEPDSDFDLALSAHTGAGMEPLIGLVAEAARAASGQPSDLVPARVRHRELVAETLAVLTAHDLASLPPEILAEVLRSASDRLGALTGRHGVEDLLDLIFSEFCIGK